MHGDYKKDSLSISAYCKGLVRLLSGPTATVIMLHYTVAPHTVVLHFGDLEGTRVSQENRATLLQGRCSTYRFSS